MAGDLAAEPSPAGLFNVIRHRGRWRWPDPGMRSAACWARESSSFVGIQHAITPERRSDNESVGGGGSYPRNRMIAGMWRTSGTAAGTSSGGTEPPP